MRDAVMELCAEMEIAGKRMMEYFPSGGKSDRLSNVGTGLRVK
jgi:hypothetical protein